MTRLSDVLSALAASRATEARALAQLAERLAISECEARGPKLLSFTEAAQALSCTVSHVSRLAARGAFQVVRVTDSARGQRISQTELETFIRQRSGDPRHRPRRARGAAPVEAQA